MINTLQKKYAKNSGKIINSIIILAALIFLISSLTPAASANINNDNKKPIVVATTTNLGYFANEVGGNNIEVLNLVPAGACPGHYDTRPTDVEAIVDAELILWNGFEPWLMELVESAGNRDVLMNKGPGGEWGPPPRGKLFVENITDALIQAFPQYEESFEIRKQDLLSSIDSCAENLKTEAEKENIKQVKVICQSFQKPFVQWLGFNVVKTFPSPEQISASQTSEIINTAENENVALIISNNASGTSFGEQIATETGIEHVVLGNYPGWMKGIDTYVKMVESNAERLFMGLESYRNGLGTVSNLKEELKGVKFQRNAAFVAAIIVAIVAALEFMIIRRK